MNNHILFIVLCFVTNIHSAQKATPSQFSAKISYKMVTKLRGNLIEQPSELIIQNHQSIFIHSKGATGLAAIDVEIKQPDGSIAKMQDGYWQDTEGSIFYKNFKKKQLIVREIVWMQPYLTSEPKLPELKWTIQEETKKISNFDCQKAIITFRGRHYTAWFTAQIPSNDGPWKFYGLPGLILEIYDDVEEVKFGATSIEIPFSVENISPPTTGLKVSFKDYKRADELEFLKMKRAQLSKMDRNSSTEIKRNTPNLIEKEYEQ